MEGFIMNHLLSVIIFLPLLGCVALLFLRDGFKIRLTALIFAAVDFVLTIQLLARFDPATHKMQFVERYGWIPSFNIEYYLGVDGISVLFMFLTSLCGWICVLASWRAIEERVKEFMMALLAMQTFMLGVFAALDLFLFYMFWEAMLIPMYLLIGVWGGPRRIYAAVKFFLYTLLGSILMLVGIIALYHAAGGIFDIPALMEVDYSFKFQMFAFMLFFVAFAVKVPMFPFHTWLPDAHVEAPTAGSIILAGVLLKMGAYGFLRFSLPMFPDASQYMSMPMIILSIAAIIYGAFLALAQDDMKKLIAYSSVSHMGFVTLGIFLFNKHGIEGAILQMFNHGVTTGALFLCVGIIYERTHTRSLADYGWAVKLTPFYATGLFIFSIASLGFPGTNGFIGELLILFGAYESSKIYLVFLFFGIILGAAYMLWMFQRIGFGAPRKESASSSVKDIGVREAVAIGGFMVFVFWVGLQPMDFLNIMSESVNNLISQTLGAP